MSRPRRHARADIGIHTVSHALAVVLIAALVTGCGRPSPKEESASPASAPLSLRTAPAEGASVQGTVKYAEGDLTINGVPAAVGAAVRNGDTVKTGADGICEITFAGRNIIQIRSNSLAVLNFESFARGIQLQSGSLAAVLKELAPTATANRFQVDTPATVAGVSGTAFYVKVLEASTTYFCLCNGAISLQDNRGGNPRRLEAAHHTAVAYVKSNGTITVKSAPVLYHSDAEMQRLAGKVGYIIKWDTPDLEN